MRNFGLIGKNIAHSFSESYFSEKFKKENISNCSYQIFDLESLEEIKKLISTKGLKGFNVTIPYKEEIIPFLDELSPTAQEIQAVNCVQILKGKKIGYNTDAYGFEKSLLPLLQKHHKKALILGDGGAAKAVKYVLKKQKIEHLTVSRKGAFIYSELTKEIIEDHNLIMNCTPLGTFPKVEEFPLIPYEFLTKKHLLYDLIYNPAQTLFLKKGKSNLAQTKNGYEMLVLQAEKSWKIWNQLL